jgi:hypothetical protein
VNTLDKGLMYSMGCIFAAVPGALLALAAHKLGWPAEAEVAGFVIAFAAPYVSLQYGFELFDEWLAESYPKR